jgi:hypothetical protein
MVGTRLIQGFPKASAGWRELTGAVELGASRISSLLIIEHCSNISILKMNKVQYILEGAGFVREARQQILVSTRFLDANRSPLRLKTL